VSAAYDALNQAIGSRQLDGNAVKAKLAQSMDPYGDIMGWYETTAPQRDPEAFKQQIISEYLASQGQGQVQPQTAAAAQATGTVIKLPPNLNRMTSASSDASGSADVSDQELFHATTSRRR
jgi:hypothetical protein